MDVRCDRCQTEYELDDESVAGAGASVQCTTCGHTFVVSRNGSVNIGTTPPSGLGSADTPVPRVSQSAMANVAGAPSSAPSVPEWVLATDEGQTHRLRDLTTLQKWVVERRVSRADRVSYRGGAWRTLGEVEELRPFFDVVDQADRQTGAARVAEPARAPEPRLSAHRYAEPPRAARPTTPATPARMHGQERGHVSPDPEDDDVLSNGPEARRRGPALSEPLDFTADEDDLSLSFKPPRTGLKVLGGLVFLGLAAGAAWFMFRDPHAFHLASGTPIPPSQSAPPAQAPAPSAQPGPAAAPSPPAANAVAPAAAAAPSPAAAPQPAAAAPSPAAAASQPAAAAPQPGPAAPTPPPTVRVGEKRAAPPAEAPAPAEPSKRAVATAAPEPKGRSYEQLVADGDHALENGQTAKAQKLYDDALRQQPNGVAALTGSAYVLMDKRRPLAAIGVFKQVLSNAPHYAPALFGLGEAYRGQGDAAQAIEAYKQYLEQSPTGSDAPAARRQIKELGEAAAAPRNQGPSAIIPSQPGVPSSSPTAPPPASAP